MSSLGGGKHGTLDPRCASLSAPGYIEAMLKSIVGIEVEIVRLVGKFKLSQNRDKRDRVSAAQALMAHGDIAMGKQMLDMPGE